MKFYLPLNFGIQMHFKCLKKHATPKDVMEKEYPFYVLIETSGSNKDHDDDKI